MKSYDGNSKTPGQLPFYFNDGGRAAAGFKGRAGDCGVRAVVIATGLPYRLVYDELSAIARGRKAKRERKKTNARDGIYRRHMRKYLATKGWEWHEFECGELPTLKEFAAVAPPRCIVATKRHFFALMAGARCDTHEQERTGLVIGYYFKKES